MASFLGMFLTNTIGLRPAETGALLAVLGIGGLFGFYLAWAIARHRTKRLLILAGCIQLFGGLLMTIPGLAAIPALRFVGAFLVGLGAGTITLGVPSILAGGRGGAEAFVLAFGVAFTFSRIGQMTAPAIVGGLLNTYGFTALATTVAAWLVLGLLFLLPVKSSLFQGALGQRGYSLTPTHREPLIVALLCLVPFYWLYWLYRAHGEVTSLAPSRSILSPRASVLASLLAPLLYPVIVTSLADALNKGAVGLGRPVYRRPWVTFLWAVLFLPAATALVQSDMNGAMREMEPRKAA